MPTSYASMSSGNAVIGYSASVQFATATISSDGIECEFHCTDLTAGPSEAPEIPSTYLEVCLRDHRGNVVGYETCLRTRLLS